MTDSNGFVETQLPCPCGKSSDAYAINDKGWGQCFSCGDKFPPKTEEYEYVPPEDFSKYEYKYMPERGLNENALRFYGVVTKFNGEGPVETCFPYPRNEFKKIRSKLIPKKQPGHFRTSGLPKNAGLFGEDKFEPGSSDTVIITEGEYDAVAAYQMMKLPSVSVSSSVSARRDLENSWEWVNSFSRIIFAFDADDAGQQAIQKCAGLFDFNKVYIAEFKTFKDANGYLEAQEQKSFHDAIKNARKFSPDNIINTFKGMRDALDEEQEQRIGTYPFRGLQEALYGTFRGEVAVFKGDTGIGKTEVFRAMEHHLLATEPDAKICIIHMEEGQSTTVRGLATYAEDFPYIHLEDHSDLDSIIRAVEALVKQEDRVNIYESFDLEDENKLLDTVRYLVSSCGVTHVFLDHITWLATGKEMDEDERRKLDRISQKIKMLAKELHFWFGLISHTNDDGKTRGSRNIVKVANTVVHLSRDVTSDSDEERNKLWFTIEKGRGHGTKTGPAGYAWFDREVLKLKDPEETFEL